MITYKRTPTIMDGLVIRYKYENGGEVSASRNGVVVQGSFPRITTAVQLGDFIAVVEQAHADYRMLKAGQDPIKPEWPWLEEVDKP